MSWQERLEWFRIGWYRRSALMLDAAGCPLWLIRWRCPAPKGWGMMLEALMRQIDPGYGE